MLKAPFPRAARQRPRVGIIMDTSGALGRKMLQGIIHYLQAHGFPWHVQVEMGTAEQAPGMKRWKGEGIIARVRSPEVRRLLARFDVPMVLDRPLGSLPGRHSPILMFPWSHTEATAAFAHLAERGFRHLAFCPMPDGQGWHRDLPFARTVEDAGGDFHLHPPPAPLKQTEGVAVKSRLEKWLAALPKPVGIFAANDDQGFRVLEACRAIGARVPDEVAVVGNDDDELVWPLCWPHLSSVDPHFQEMGYRAAAILDALMSGRAPSPADLEPPLAHVVGRASTDVIYVGDDEVRSAVAFIRDHAREMITVKDVIHRVAISRRSLERRFHRGLGRSPAQEILRVRVNAAKELLASTDLRTPEIAWRCGFANASRLTVAFSRMVGSTPTAYRREARLIR